LEILKFSFYQSPRETRLRVLEALQKYLELRDANDGKTIAEGSYEQVMKLQEV